MLTKTLDSKSEVRVLGLFELFADQGRPLSLSDIAAHLAIPVSSCFNLVRAVEERGYLYAARPRGPLYPTRRLYEVAKSVLEGDVVTEEIRACLATLRDKTGETVCLGCRKDAFVLYLDVEESMQSIRFSVRIGDRRDLHSNSIGKAILSTMSPDELQACLTGLSYQRHTSNTLRSPKELADDIERGRSAGWYANRGESAPDALACAVPVRLRGNWYGVAIVGPASRMDAKLTKHLTALRAAARAIEQLSGERDERPSA